MKTGTYEFEWFAFNEGGPSRDEALRGVWLCDPDQKEIKWLNYDDEGYRPPMHGYTHFAYGFRPNFPKNQTISS